MIGLLAEITPNGRTNSLKTNGYSLSEIGKIESFYDIKIEGDLKRFFLEFGRSPGAIGFDAFILPYSGFYAVKSPSHISGHLRTQYDFRDDLMKQARPFCKSSPFLFSIEHETQYYFLRTKADEPLRGVSPEDDYSQLSDDPEIVYHYDENNGVVINTEMTLKDYLRSRVSTTPVTELGSGEMILI